jgi:lipoate-protein ligase A
MVRYIPLESGAPDWNMAVDEYLLRSVMNGGPPALRFCLFDPPSVTLGKHQKRVPRPFEGYPAVKRPTGGRAVLHDGDLVYSMTAPVDHPLFGGSIEDTYKRIAVRILEGLRAKGLSAELNVGRPRGERELCFDSTARYEIVFNGKKIVGAAQVRRESAFLEQGSIQTDLDPLELSVSIKNAMGRASVRFEERPLSEEERREAESLLKLYPIIGGSR